MTTTKRCEVCGKETKDCLTNSDCFDITHCHGTHPYTSPRPDEWEKEFDDSFQPYGYAPEVKSFIRNLLSSHASKAREEGRKEGYEVGYTNAQIDLKADDEIIGAEPCGGGCNGYKRAGASHCASIGCGSRPNSQTNPKKE